MDAIVVTGRIQPFLGTVRCTVYRQSDTPLFLVCWTLGVRLVFFVRVAHEVWLGIVAGWAGTLPDQPATEAPEESSTTVWKRMQPLAPSLTSWHGA